MGRRMPPHPDKMISLRTRIAAERRVDKVIRENRLVFVWVGGKVAEDRPIAMGLSEQHGTGIPGNEYDAYIRAIVEAALNQ